MNKNRHRVVLSKSRRSDSRLVSQEKGWGGAQLSAYSQKRAGRGVEKVMIPVLHASHYIARNFVFWQIRRQLSPPRHGCDAPGIAYSRSLFLWVSNATRKVKSFNPIVKSHFFDR